jgi:hypothetical protein
MKDTEVTPRGTRHRSTMKGFPLWESVWRWCTIRLWALCCWCRARRDDVQKPFRVGFQCRRPRKQVAGKRRQLSHGRARPGQWHHTRCRLWLDRRMQSQQGTCGPHSRRESHLIRLGRPSWVDYTHPLSLAWSASVNIAICNTRICAASSIAAVYTSPPSSHAKPSQPHRHDTTVHVPSSVSCAGAVAPMCAQTGLAAFLPVAKVSSLHLSSLPANPP